MAKPVDSMSQTTNFFSATFIALCIVVFSIAVTSGHLSENNHEDAQKWSSKRFIVDQSSSKNWATLEQFSACALTCVPGYEKLTQVCCDTGLDALCLNLPWDTLKAQLGTCIDSSATGVTKKAWVSLEQFASCFLTCVPGYEKLSDACCQTGIDAICTNLPWDLLKSNLGSCQNSTKATSLSTIVTSSTTTVATNLPYWLPWSDWICTEQLGSCFQRRLRNCSTGIDQDCTVSQGGVAYNIGVCTKTTCPDFFTTTTTKTTVSTTPQGFCQDDPHAIGCLDKEVLREVCRERHTALTICPRSCGLCDQLTTSVTDTTAHTDTCQDDVASNACNDPTVLTALCHDNKFAWRFCPRSCNLCDTCWDYLNCSSPEAKRLFCGRDDYAIQYCRKTCGKCAHKPLPVKVNQCGDPVANELICELLHTEICICQDPEVRDLCQNFCNDKCTTKVTSLPSCSPISTTAKRMRKDQLLQRV